MHRLRAIIKLPLCLATACLLAIACNRTESGATASLETTLLLYEEQEQGTDSYPVRILVNRDFVRFDDGYDASDYVLFDRRSRTIFSVAHAERSILVIDHLPVVAPLPADIRLAVQRSRDDEAPAIGGRQPVHMQFMANDTICLEAVVVPGLLVDVSTALAEYADALGARQLKTLQSVPAEMQTACFLVRYVYLPGQQLRAGLPIREWDAAGYWRRLRDFRENEAVAAGLFELPRGYAEIRIRQ
ncbi:MAG: hypothetical protein PVJ66_09290 [Gammaproteobacteria bacterium]|jgi:hypothetical protein